MNNDEFGVIYVATGKKYIHEANLSIKTLRKVDKNLHVTLFTDMPSEVKKNYFNNIIKIDNPSYSFFDKIPCMLNTPYQKTLYLDTDTLIKDEIEDIKIILEKYDLAIAHAPLRKFIDIPEIPEIFPELNTGVIAYRMSKDMKELFKNWEKEYKLMQKKYKKKLHDQPSFRKVLFNSNIKTYIIPPEYNLRTDMPYLIGGNSTVKIIHGRNQEALKVFYRDKISWGPYVYIYNPIKNIIDKIKYYLNKIIIKILDKFNS